MKKLVGLVAVGLLLTSTAWVQAADQGQKQAVKPEAESSVALFPCVKYKDLHNIAPCAVPLIVQVPDPCQPKCNPCDPCVPCPKPRCVNVKICVPQTCCPPKITRRHGGKYVKYDYGKYEVEIRVKKGYIVVDYDD